MRNGELVSDLVRDTPFRARLAQLQLSAAWMKNHGAADGDQPGHTLVAILREYQPGLIHACIECQSEFRAYVKIVGNSATVIPEETRISLETAAEYRRLSGLGKAAKS